MKMCSILFIYNDTYESPNLSLETRKNQKKGEKVTTVIWKGKIKTILNTLHSVWGFWAPPRVLAAFPLFLCNVTLTLSRTILSFPLHGCCGLVFDFKFIQHSFSKILMSMLSHQFTKHLLKVCCAVSLWAPGALCASPHCPAGSRFPPRWGNEKVGTGYGHVLGPVCSVDESM